MRLFFNALNLSNLSMYWGCMMTKLAKHNSHFQSIGNEKNRTDIRQFIPQFISGFTLMEFWRVTAAWSAVWCRKNYERREWRELAWAPALAAAVCRRRGAAAASYELALTGLAVCGTAPRSSAAVYRRRLPARATTVYNNTKATELTQAGNGGVRRATRPQRATYEAPANREEPSYSYFTGC